MSRTATIACVLAVLAGAVALSSGAAAAAAARATAARESPRAAAATVRRLLAGIPEDGSALGYPDAPVTLQVFGDLECPVCRALALGPLGDLIRRDVRRHELRIIDRSLETATREPLTFAVQQGAALAAGRQNKLWYYVELFYRLQGREHSGYVTEKYLDDLARLVPGLDFAAWQAARREHKLYAQLESDARTAERFRFEGTPAFLIGRTGGRMRVLEGSIEETAPFQAAIDRLLRHRGQIARHHLRVPSRRPGGLPQTLGDARRLLELTAWLTPRWPRPTSSGGPS